MWLFIAIACLLHQATYSEGLKDKRHLNPQEFMSPNEIIKYWGYPSEEYEILTEDGYYLKANRIPHGLRNPGMSEPRPVVLLVPGVLAEARCWLANIPNNSLGFFLADAGYDVWIINNRGTTWSRRHQNLSINQEEFWNFSFHEQAMYDIPATIDFILKKTQQDKLHYIGHSQGGSLGFISFTAMPQIAKKIKLFMCFSPPYTLVRTKGLMKMIVSLHDRVKTHLWGNKEFVFFSNKLKTINANLCSHPGIDKLCLQLIFLVSGFNEYNLNVSRTDVYMGTYPDFTSVKTVRHWSQIAKSKEFKYFDYGKENKVVYNMTKPPFYKIEEMMVPTAVWSGGKDIIAHSKDIEELLPRITNLVFYKNIPSWHHADFLWGLDAPSQLYTDVLYLMETYK
ncbi:lysosomal acid lipase/cholesteryl ester hydrolase [Anolis carolinensis]|uniref:lysosomal acid lipase/cholesteryl ester hydrolase n=1 Tax=Anolis carolinensis TaxID=28377 RepID=UPI002F2B4142